MPLRNSNLYEHVGVGITEDVNLRHIVTNIYIYISWKTFYSWLFLYDLLTGWWMVSNLAVFVFHVSHNRLVMQDYLRSRKKLIEKSIEIKRKRKGLKNFDVCFSVLFSCYDQSVISEMTTEHFAVSNRLRYSWYFIVS